MIDMNEKDACNPLLLKNQLCFPLYASARKIVAAYTPFLKEIGLTYAQYVTMMVLWEEKAITMRDLGERLYLDSGTLTPVLKKLESMGYVKRYRKPDDERVVVVEITPDGIALRDKALEVPPCHGLSGEPKRPPVHSGRGGRPEEKAVQDHPFFGRIKNKDCCTFCAAALIFIHFFTTSMFPFCNTTSIWSPLWISPRTILLLTTVSTVWTINLFRGRAPKAGSNPALAR